MKRKDKHKELSFPAFLRYRKGEMSGEERNSFERELQRDPFAEEALEGFELVPDTDIEKDLQRLEGRLGRRTRRNRGMIYRIAASVAVLMIISSIFIVLDRDKTPEQPVIPDQAVVLEIEKPLPLKETPDEKKLIVKEKSQVREKTESYQITVAEEEFNEQKEELPERIAENIREEPRLAVNDAISAELAEPSAARRSVKNEAASEGKIEASGTGSKTSGTVVSAEDNLPIPGVSVMIKGTTTGVISDSNGNFSIEVPQNKNVTLVASFIGMTPVEIEAQPGKNVPVVMNPDVAALSEVVVVGYGRARKSEEAASSTYNPPRPADGKDSFDKYVSENIRRPDSATQGQRVVVVAGFRVRQDGSLDSIKIIRSPDKSFSDEAVRLIREGPAWLPAERDGSAIDDNVRVRIVFK